jgi:hypothetical protein
MQGPTFVQVSDVRCFMCDGPTLALSVWVCPTCESLHLHPGDGLCAHCDQPLREGFWCMYCRGLVVMLQPRAATLRPLAPPVDGVN